MRVFGIRGFPGVRESPGVRAPNSKSPKCVILMHFHFCRSALPGVAGSRRDPTPKKQKMSNQEFTHNWTYLVFIHQSVFGFLGMN